MALSRQRAHERKVHELSLENQDLRKDVDKLENALSLHKRIKKEDDTSVKGLIRKEVGGSIWQHGGDGKLYSYKSSRDLDDKYCSKTTDKSRNNKKQNITTPQRRDIELQLNVDKIATKEKMMLKGGSSIGSKKIRSTRPSSAPLSKSKELKDHNSESNNGNLCKVEVEEDLFQKTVVSPNEVGDDPFNNIDQEKNKVPVFDEEGNKCEGMNSEPEVKSSRTEVRIQVLSNMINKLRESWNLEEHCTRPHDGGKAYDPLVVEWLHSLNLKQVDKYIEIFTHNEIDMDSLKLLSEHQLKAMGIDAVGSLTKLLHGIEKLRIQSNKPISAKIKTSPKLPTERIQSGKSEKSHQDSFLTTRSILTTNSGKNTFSPKDMLQDLEDFEPEHEVHYSNYYNKSHTKESKINGTKLNKQRESAKSKGQITTGRSVINKNSSRTKKDNDAVGNSDSSAISSRRGSGGAVKKNKYPVTSGRFMQKSDKGRLITYTYSVTAGRFMQKSDKGRLITYTYSVTAGRFMQKSDKGRLITYTYSVTAGRFMQKSDKGRLITYTYSVTAGRFMQKCDKGRLITLHKKTVVSPNEVGDDPFNSIDQEKNKVPVFDEEGNKCEGMNSEPEVKSSRTEVRIQVLSNMINKLRESWNLEEHCTRPHDGGKAYDPLVVEWLHSLNLKQVDKYIEIFTHNEIDMDSLKLLSEHQLKAMGIDAVGSLTKLLHGIEKLRIQSNKPISAKIKTSPKLPTERIQSGKSEKSHQDSFLTTRSILTTNSGKNTFSPKDMLQDLEDFEPEHEVHYSNYYNKSHTKESKINGTKLNKQRESAKSKGQITTGRSVINKNSSRTKKDNDAVGNSDSSAISSRRGSGGAVKKNKYPVTSGRFMQKSDKAAAAAAKQHLHGKDEIHTMIEDISADETEDGFEHVEKEVEKETDDLSPEVQSGAILIPQHVTDNTDAQSVAESEDGDDNQQLKGIEKEIRVLADNIGNPGAMERITLLHNQLKEIQKQIILKKKLNDIPVHNVKHVAKDTKKVNNFENFDIEGKAMLVVSPHVEGKKNQENLYELDLNTFNREDTEAEIKLLGNDFEEKEDQSQNEANAMYLMKKTDHHTKSTTPGKSAGTISGKSGVASRNMSKGDLLKEVRKQKDDHRKQIRHLESELSRLKHKDPLRSCEISVEQLHYSPLDLIGEGAFSQVYHGTYQGSEVAIKRLNIPLNAQDKNYFMAEVNLLKDLRHPRVLLLVGVCTSSRLPLMVLEYMANGSLYNYLHNPENESLDHAAYYQIARDTALGMNYLHLHKPTVLHLDLKSMNVLLNLQLRAKIADFGFSKLRHDADMIAKQQSKSGSSSSNSSNSANNKAETEKAQAKGTPAWLAPEMLDFKQVTTKADVFSYGVILWEMLTRKHPYQGCSVFQILERVRKNNRPEIPKECPPKLAKLISKCWDKNIAKRPQFKNILITLDQLHLPSDWKNLFTSAGIPESTLSDVNATRTLIDIVYETLEKIERPADVPMLELYDSDTEVKNGRKQIYIDSSTDEEYEEYEDIHSSNQKDSSVLNRANSVEDEVAFYNQLANALQGFDSENTGVSESIDPSTLLTTSEPGVECIEKAKGKPVMKSKLGHSVKPQREAGGSKSQSYWPDVLAEYKVPSPPPLPSTDIPAVAAAPSSYECNSSIKNPWSSSTSKSKFPTQEVGVESDNSQTTKSVNKSRTGKSTQSLSSKGLPASSSTPMKMVPTYDLRASQLVATKNHLKPSVSAEPSVVKPKGNSKITVSSNARRADITASQLVNQRGILKSTSVLHPRQLPDLSQVDNNQLCDLAEILRKAVSQRRTLIEETNTLDSVVTTSWDLSEE